ncbi:DoxX family protein [Rhodobium gokarnense]|uniref:Oxidoreductase n=1 Tax=Rhodobium gokarnense TaxID=364296 RepID=A0ABT3H6W8_9HYPH|nr:DoxX family protein [Rhodobium gokarnense]MCW2306131.1 putative oxidoreductase [Rhodobium gokarnense]
MSLTSFDGAAQRPILAFMAPFYTAFAQPLGWLLFRIIIGGILVVEGWPKIQAPFAQTGFVEGIGFYPGWFWSPALAAVQFFGGLMIVLGLFTRPVALAVAFMLFVTLVFHVTHPYGDAFLTAAGLDALGRDADAFLTAAGQRRLLDDGGAAFLAHVQRKAELASTFWFAGAAIIAAFGGGRISLDRMLLRREF